MTAPESARAVETGAAQESTTTKPATKETTATPTSSSASLTRRDMLDATAAASKSIRGPPRRLLRPGPYAASMDGAEDVDGGSGASPRDARLRGGAAEVGLDITGRVVLASFVGGAAGLVAMAPVLIGLPALLGLFRAEPLIDVAELGRVLGLAPSVPLGLVVFALGGVVALPLLFVVVGAFLPPREPRTGRGVTFATIMWTGFVLAFWPGEPAGVIFLGLSLAGHWIYGYALGWTMERLAYVPEHAV